MKQYNITADLLVLAKAYYNKGQKKDAVKLFIRAMDEADSADLVEYLDETNQDLDPTVVEEVETEEVLSDEVIDEILEDSKEETEEVESECESEEEVVEAEEETKEVETEEELPEVEEVVAQVMKKKATLANLNSLSGKTSARKSAIDKFLKK